MRVSFRGFVHYQMRLSRVLLNFFYTNNSAFACFDSPESRVDDNHRRVWFVWWSLLSDLFELIDNTYCAARKPESESFDWVGVSSVFLCKIVYNRFVSFSYDLNITYLRTLHNCCQFGAHSFHCEIIAELFNWCVFFLFCLLKLVRDRCRDLSSCNLTGHRRDHGSWSCYGTDWCLYRMLD